MALLFLLLIVGIIVSVTPLSGFENETGFHCGNDGENWIFCQFRPRADQSKNCSEYRLDIPQDDSSPKSSCISKDQQGLSGECSCSLRTIIVMGVSHTVILMTEDRQLSNTTINTATTVKPRTPTITSVEQLKNGNFVVKWKKNYSSGTFSKNLVSLVTYRKKGESEEVSEKVNKLMTSHEILGEHLEPRTTYVVSVKTHLSFHQQFSDSSKEVEFVTPASAFIEHLAVIISLSFASVILTSVAFGCLVRYKTKWWDKVAKPQNSSVLSMLPREKKLLQPSEPALSSVYVEEPLYPNDGKPWSKCSLDPSSKSLQQSSGISSGGSSLGYANSGPDIIASIQEALCKALPQLGQKLPEADAFLTESNKNNSLLSTDYSPCSGRDDDLKDSGSSSFDNRTYSILIPSIESQITSDSSEIQTQPAVICDPAYQPSEGDVMRSTSPDQVVPVCLAAGQQDAELPPAASSGLQTDFSYQPCNADSGSSSSADTSSLSSTSSDINIAASCQIGAGEEDGCEDSHEADSGAVNPAETSQDVCGEQAPVCDANPCYGSLPAFSHSSPIMDDDYQAFQSLVKQPDIALLEESSGDQWEQPQLDKHPEESSTKISQSSSDAVLPDFSDNAQAGRCLPEFETSLFSFLPSDHSEAVITDIESCAESGRKRCHADELDLTRQPLCFLFN
ncbi:uncharacterized protein LOC115376370 isoform X1 [Myripristis murdjan]|nr:uncharacterized protein LOC115376370 isoform X1 [Myripristis murdjan]